jgi:protein-disulfide isomerase
VRTTRSVAPALLDWGATILIVACAVAVTAIVARREFFPPYSRPPGVSFTPQPDWESYSALGHRLGPEPAKVVFVEFADFQCPACRVHTGRMEELRKRYPNDVAVVYRHFPLPSTPHSLAAAVASECAAEQGRFTAMHEALFRRQREIGSASWREFAELAGVPDQARFERCLDDPAPRSTVIRDRDAALRIGATGTPTVVVNGVRFSGAVPLEILDSLVRATGAVPASR